jgi:uncharacterized membrane protein YqiK
MARQSTSIANQQNLFKLAVAGAKKYATQLPKEVQAIAKGLADDESQVATLNAQQESAKAELAKLSLKLKAAAKEATVKRAKIVRMAEATFGPNAPELKEFRPATEGRV